jgi:HK97 family phage prohead protease
MQRREGPGAPSFRYAGLTLKGVGGDGTFSGYASLFGEVDLGRDAIERGAFAASIDKRGAGGVRMLFQHDPAEVIGRWTVLREDERGLYVEGKLSTDVARAREVLALMKAGALDGLSIGFRAVKTRADRKAGVRRILEADLWEISVVTFPMLPTARVSNVKHRRFYRDRETELVRLMRRAARAMASNHFNRG